VGKLVTLKFDAGSFEQGFLATLQIGDEQAHPVTRVTAKLPPNSEILAAYSRWRFIYIGLITSALGGSRPLCLPRHPQPIVTLQDCQQAAQELRDRLNTWLRADCFYPIWTTWLTKLRPTDEVRILLQTSDVNLQKLPWHLWDLLMSYPQVEIALSALDYDKVTQELPATHDRKILAILGNSEGIDIESDRQTLEQIAGTAVQFLPEPQLKDLTEELWHQPWRILFFAGHSATQETGKMGRIAVNSTESLSIDQLHHALKTAVQRGLQLAIFNSCDGLGLARELADLQIPQLIVMREPVPDAVAQAFLKYCLTAYAGGKSLYQAVREARERLQGLENQFPCATWLPVIYQNPAEIPPTWQELMGANVEAVSPAETAKLSAKLSAPVATPAGLQRRHRSSVRELVQVGGISVAVAASIILGRSLGLLQPLELQAFDHFMRLRPQELPDSRLLIITVDEEDVKNQERDRGSLSDSALNRLLAKLEQPAFQPRVIGLDIYRDFPANPRQPSLGHRLKQTSNLVAVCRVRDVENNISGIEPPPEVPSDRLGFSDFVEDADGVIRRHLLYIDPDVTSPCSVADALSLQLALRYLAVEGIQPHYYPDGSFQLGNTDFRRLQPHTGGYQAIDTRGSQILLNYRQAAFEQVSLRQVLKQIAPSALKDRIVLIGVTARSAGDYLSTPYGTRSQDKQAGVIVHAHMVSQILSAVQDRRPLLWSWTPEAEMVWIWGWAGVGGLLVWLVRSPLGNFIQHRLPATILFVLTACGSVLVCCHLIFIRGGWIPLLPAELAIVTTATLVGVLKPIPTHSHCTD
jgi:CHASE2 domain-containing sensor protein